MENVIQPQPTYKKEVSIAHVIALGVFGFLSGILFYVLLNVQFPWYVLPIVLAFIFGTFGYFWKVRVYEPLSLEDLTPLEWVIWIFASIAISPFVSGTIAYYIYKYHNRYPVKWRRINIILLIGFLVYAIIILFYLLY